jgi:hypothetical protein
VRRCGGNGEAIDTFIEDCKQSFADTKLDNLGDFKKAIQLKLKDCRKDLRSVGDDTKMHLLIAAHIGTTYAVWKATSYMLSEVIEPDMIGFTDYLYRHTVKEFHPKTLPITQLILLSLRVLDFARQTSTCVDQPYSIVIANDTGLHVFDHELTAQYVQSITVFGDALNKLLLACGDTSMRSDVFEEHLKEFTRTAQHLRPEYLQTIGQRAFMRTLEPGYSGDDPVSVIPSGSIATFGYGSGGSTFSVREQTAEEMKQHRAMLEAAKQDYNQLAMSQFIALLKGRPVVYSGEESIHVRGTSGSVEDSASS